MFIIKAVTTLVLEDALLYLDVLDEAGEVGTVTRLIPDTRQHGWDLHVQRIVGFPFRAERSPIVACELGPPERRCLVTAALLDTALKQVLKIMTGIAPLVSAGPANLRMDSIARVRHDSGENLHSSPIFNVLIVAERATIIERIPLEGM
jgi:hypothetical protein